MDRPEEAFEPGRGVRGLGDPVDRVLEDLGLLPVVDVLHHADHPAQVPVLLDEEEAAVVEPAVAPVLVPEPVVDVVGDPVPFGQVEEPEGLLPVVGMDALGPFGDAAHLLGLEAQDLLQAAAPDDFTRRQVVIVDDLARGGDDELVFLPLVDVGRLVGLRLRLEGRHRGVPDPRGRGRGPEERGIVTAEDPHSVLGPMVARGGPPCPSPPGVIRGVIFGPGASPAERGIRSGAGRTLSG